MTTINKVAVIGGGVIGGGWIARFLQNGFNVTVFDPASNAKEKIDAVLANADIAAKNLAISNRPKPGKLEYCSTIEQAVRDVSLIAEAVPERLDIKKTVYGQIESAALADALIASSTSGLLPTQLQSDLANPERFLVVHPFNPVYLLPLVELVGGKQTSSETIEKAKQIYTSIGMRPLHVRKEIDAFIADRFLEAVWREALWLVKDGIATTEEIDDAIIYGFGLRWAQMGLFDTYRVAGGEQGMRHFIDQFGPCLSLPWTKLMDVPELTEELAQTIADQSDAQSGHYTIREMEQIRDKNLVDILKALKSNQWGAGKTLAGYEEILNSKQMEN